MLKFLDNTSPIDKIMVSFVVVLVTLVGYWVYQGVQQIPEQKPTKTVVQKPTKTVVQKPTKTVVQKPTKTVVQKPKPRPKTRLPRRKPDVVSVRAVYSDWYKYCRKLKRDVWLEDYKRVCR